MCHVLMFHEVNDSKQSKATMSYIVCRCVYLCTEASHDSVYDSGILIVNNLCT